MYEFSRRAFLKGVGKVTAALGIGLSLGSGCAKEEPEVETEAVMQEAGEDTTEDTPAEAEEAVPAEEE